MDAKAFRFSSLFMGGSLLSAAKHFCSSSAGVLSAPTVPTRQTHPAYACFHDRRLARSGARAIVQRIQDLLWCDYDDTYDPDKLWDSHPQAEPGGMKMVPVESESVISRAWRGSLG
jgi:hypothetical protein